MRYLEDFDWTAGPSFHFAVLYHDNLFRLKRVGRGDRYFEAAFTPGVMIFASNILLTRIRLLDWARYVRQSPGASMRRGVAWSGTGLLGPRGPTWPVPLCVPPRCFLRRYGIRRGLRQPRHGVHDTPASHVATNGGTIPCEPDQWRGPARAQRAPPVLRFAPALWVRSRLHAPLAPPARRDWSRPHSRR